MPQGLPAGEVARLLGVPHNTMSTHLAVLTRADLLKSERKSRSIVYRANFDGLGAAIGFLVTDCCAGHPELCGNLIADISPCCSNLEPTNV